MRGAITCTVSSIELIVVASRFPKNLVFPVDVLSECTCSDLSYLLWSVGHKGATLNESDTEGRCLTGNLHTCSFRVLVAAAGLSLPRAAWSLSQQSPQGNFLYW